MEVFSWYQFFVSYTEIHMILLPLVVILHYKQHYGCSLPHFVLNPHECPDETDELNSVISQTPSAK